MMPWVDHEVETTVIPAMLTAESIGQGLLRQVMHDVWKLAGQKQKLRFKV